MMSSKNIYENLPLKNLNKSDKKQLETEPLVTQKIKTIQNIFNPIDLKSKKRKSNPDIYNKIPVSNIRKPKSSKSISEMFCSKNINGLNETVGNSKKENNSSKSSESLCRNSGDKQDNVSVKSGNGVESNIKDKCLNIHSTPTSTFDDGYESCNSTPLVSGKVQPYKRSNTTSNLILTCTVRKKELHVQLEEDERGYESFALSASSSQDGDEGETGGLSVNSRFEDDNRETWGSNADFLLSIIGFAVDLANVWRFPYLCYKNGGGKNGKEKPLSDLRCAFLIPYTLMLIFGAVPLFYMELILGQFNRQGPVSLWRICPLFKGVGFCAVLIAFYVSFYYNVIIAWALYFLGTSITSELPWLHCNNSWNTEKCWESMTPLSGDNKSLIIPNNFSTNQHTPASEFFHRAVLEMQWSDGLHDMGYPKWQLVLCLITVYATLYISLFKGVKSSGKVVWITATMPYVVLTILLIRGLMLPGAVKGISYYLKPELSKLKETQVWLDAAVQIFYSVGAGFGVHLSYASYNTFHNNCYRDCLVTTAVNSFTSFFSGFVIFTYLGFMSYKQGVDISQVAAEGPGLVFQVYPEAVATLPGSYIWSMLFFFMLIMLGLDSGMGGLECVITGLMDEFSHFFKKRKFGREIFTLIVITASFCVALINVTPGGIYMFHLFDTYAAGISLLCSALFEAVAVSWFYGLERFTQDVDSMLGHKPGLYWRICWKFISPLFIITVVLFGLIYHEPLQYNDYFYPNWAEWVGWGLTLSSISMIPLCAIIQIMRTPGTFSEKIALSISPEEEHDAIRRNKLIGRFKSKHWLYV